MEMIYLASPYTHDSYPIRKMRFEAAARKTAEILKTGVNCFSPIVHSIPLEKYDLPTCWEFWETFDRDFIGFCTKICVLMLEGFERSIGVKAEIKIAVELGKPIQFLDPSRVETVVSMAGAIYMDRNGNVKIQDPDPVINPLAMALLNEVATGVCPFHPQE